MSYTTLHIIYDVISAIILFTFAAWLFRIRKVEKQIASISTALKDDLLSLHKKLQQDGKEVEQMTFDNVRAALREGFTQWHLYLTDGTSRGYFLISNYEGSSVDGAMLAFNNVYNTKLSPGCAYVLYIYMEDGQCSQKPDRKIKFQR